ncbi:mavicyanin-like [Phoenix dactylifera]|uniref:Mavicyanin-like n=1 Tax=Phoenix dactylifera TaxID=42345 RepID=A0A8B7BJ00_PHODC|nr:mavicyanin-like [Phoenix dactylifera]
MAFNLMLAFVAIIISALRTIAVPAEYVVGDEKGWAPGVNYMAWAEGKEFRVGDTLVFEYNLGDHNVIEVSREEFKACNVSRTRTALTSGHDAITLTAGGKKWYLCGKENHCNLGQKLVVTILPSITVQPAQSPNPSTPPASGLSKKISSRYKLLMVVVAAMIML